MLLYLLCIPNIVGELVISRKAFSFTAPTVWNNLSLSTRSAVTFYSIKSFLKIELFGMAFTDVPHRLFLPSASVICCPSYIIFFRLVWDVIWRWSNKSVYYYYTDFFCVIIIHIFSQFVLNFNGILNPLFWIFSHVLE